MEFVCWEESLMLVTSPPEKRTTIRGSAKHCGNVPSGSSSSVQNINKGSDEPGGQARRALRQKVWEPVLWDRKDRALK